MAASNRLWAALRSALVLGIAALAMPALTFWLPGLALIPTFAGRGAVAAGPALSDPPSWLAAHAGLLALGGYAIVTALGLVRLLAELVMDGSGKMISGSKTVQIEVKE